MKAEEYWDKRYRKGGSSGDGSRGLLAKFKTDVVNNIIEEYNVTSMIDWGFGDGEQLKTFTDINYLGFEVSETAVKRAQLKYPEKFFALKKDYKGQKTNLTISLDVIYHLIEDQEYYDYMDKLFFSSTDLVLIYSSNYEEPRKNHQRRRKFTAYVQEHYPEFKLIKTILNPYPYDPNTGKGSLSNFYLYKKFSR